MAELKLVTRMLLPTALLILLSVTIGAEEAKRCYWCGPLAEQVHRSQRAPSCGQELHETTCDKGYTHCAIVATSPPYAESRLCVKFYQDECYSLYCNSSKAWRMVCPCQGNLCNGQNTDRETRAFTTLANIVSKNKRIKRRLVDVTEFIPLTPRKKVLNEDNIILPSDNETTPSYMQSDMHMDEQLIETTQTISDINDVYEKHDSENDLGNNIEENTKDEQDIESEMQGDQPIEMNDSAATTEADNKNIEETSNVVYSETVMHDIKMDSIIPTMAMIEEKDDKYTVTIPVEFVKETQLTTEMSTLTSMIPTSIEIELSVVHIQNPTDNLPPPEAMQENVTPTKTTTLSTMGTIEISTNTNHIETIPPIINEISKKNDQTQEIKKKNDNSKDMEKNNGDELASAQAGFVYFMNLMLCIIIL